MFDLFGRQRIRALQADLRLAYEDVLRLRQERDDARAQRDRLNSENALHHEANKTLSQEIRRLGGVVAQLQAQIAAHDEPAPVVTPEQEYRVNVPAAKPTRPSRTRGVRVTHKEGSVQAESVGEMPAPHLE